MFGRVRVKKDSEGKFQLVIIKMKMSIPLRRFEKLTVLSSSEVDYLKEYESRLSRDKDGKITDTKTLERIRSILSKQKIEKDPILDFGYKSETIYSEGHYRRMGYKGYSDWKEQQEIKQKEEQKKKLEESLKKKE